MTNDPTFELDQHHAFQRREWRVQRIGWWVMAALVVAGASGLLGGSGPLAEGRASAPGIGLEVEYPRLLHVQRGAQLRFSLAPRDEAPTVLLGWDLVRGLPPKTITPTPTRVEPVIDGLRYHFARGDPDASLLVVFEVRPEHAGPLVSSVGRNAPHVVLRQLVLP